MNWRRPAVIAQFVYACAAFGMAAYILAPGINELTVLSALRSFLAGLVAVWWGQLLARYLSGQPTPDTNGQWRALAAFFPWLTALRVSLWLLSLFALEGNTEANPVALTALLTISLAYALAKNAVYGTLTRFAADPTSPLGRLRLASWLNLAAPLAFGIGVINSVPVHGLSTGFDAQDVAVYGVHALLDFAATLLALLAVGWPQMQQMQKDKTEA